MSWKMQQESATSIEYENENSEIRKRAYTAGGTENQNGQLVNDIKRMLEMAECASLIKCRINRVPCQLRKVNEQAYTPTFISIGPFHHFNKDFQTLENYKVKYLKSFIARANVKLENLACIIRDNEETTRTFYAETMLGRLHNNDFVKMILMDSIFILELFLRNYYRLWESDDPKVADQWMTPLLMLDLLLVENQLPFFVLEILFTLAFPSPSKKIPFFNSAYFSVL